MKPSMEMVSEELAKQGTVCHIHTDKDDRIGFEVDLGQDMNFLYEVRLRYDIQPSFALSVWGQKVMMKRARSNATIALKFT
ncbi:hypothetical protein [Providencia hangzhouensis]|uniref:hypothetical protein n=1 Tax=Providencia hangzhouensis TaxID=3031799 RepID=UPI0034DD384B